jgi:hypothetical protein
MTITDSDVADLTRRSAEGNAALVRGDIEGFLEQIMHSKDYTLMAPFGGAPTRGLDTSSESRAAMARFFKAATFDQEVVATYDSEDLVVLVTIERVGARSAGYPSRTGRCASRRSTAAKGVSGGSCTGTPIRS